MKLKHFLILTIFILTSCSDKNKTSIDDDSIILSNYSIRFLAGDEYTVDVLSDTEALSLIEKEPKIASAWWTNDGKSIRIKGESVGSTSIYIIDKKQTDKVAEIKIISDYFAGNYKEDGSKAIIIVDVASQDKSIKDEIENDLKNIATCRTGTMYSFNNDTRSVIISKQNGSKHTGSYDWNINQLTVITNDIIYNYAFQHIGNNIVRLELNYLDTYKTKYPDTPILAAKLLLFLSQVISVP